MTLHAQLTAAITRVRTDANFKREIATTEAMVNAIIVVLAEYYKKPEPHQENDWAKGVIDKP